MNSHKCEECGKAFLPEWHLKKHMIMHSLSYTSSCHYYNNKKFCPFEQLGCKFSHRLSGLCNYDEKCHKKLCPIQQTNQSKIEIEFENFDLSDIIEYDKNVDERTDKSSSSASVVNLVKWKISHVWNVKTVSAKGVPQPP